ncbi:MAG: hypothetical protein ACFFB5_10275 [Promethearchaeota archaeon]
MISITIELMSAVRNPFPSKKRKMKLTELNDGLLVGKLLIDSGFLEKELNHLIPIVNGTRMSMDYELKDGDHLWITFPLGGGFLGYDPRIFLPY